MNWMRRNVERVKRMRAISEKRLRKMGFEVPPSQANFVLARLHGHDMAAVAAALRRRGILVRHFPHSIFHDALRISIGTPAQMEALFKALEPLIRPLLTLRANGAMEKSGRRASHTNHPLRADSCCAAIRAGFSAADAALMTTRR
jgi:hypothetical protein